MGLFDNMLDELFTPEVREKRRKEREERKAKEAAMREAYDEIKESMDQRHVKNYGGVYFDLANLKIMLPKSITKEYKWVAVPWMMLNDYRLNRDVRQEDVSTGLDMMSGVVRWGYRLYHLGVTIILSDGTEFEVVLSDSIGGYRVSPDEPIFDEPDRVLATIRQGFQIIQNQQQAAEEARKEKEREAKENERNAKLISAIKEKKTSTDEDFDEKLRKLKKLKDENIISPEDYEKAKNNILEGKI